MMIMLMMMMIIIININALLCRYTAFSNFNTSRALFFPQSQFTDDDNMLIHDKVQRASACAISFSQFVQTLEKRPIVKARSPRPIKPSPPGVCQEGFHSSISAVCMQYLTFKLNFVLVY